MNERHTGLKVLLLTVAIMSLQPYGHYQKSSLFMLAVCALCCYGFVKLSEKS